MLEAILIICLVLVLAKAKRPRRRYRHFKGAQKGVVQRSELRLISNDVVAEEPELAHQEDAALLAERQLEVVKQSRYTAQRLLGKAESNILYLIEGVLKDYYKGNDYRLFAQVSLGEILRAEGAAYWAINSKRVDFLLIDRFGKPVAAIEYQGSGHHQGTAAVRDEIKRLSCWKAGVPFYEIPSHYDRQAVRKAVLHLLSQHEEPHLYETRLGLGA